VFKCNKKYEEEKVRMLFYNILFVCICLLNVDSNKTSLILKLDKIRWFAISLVSLKLNSCFFFHFKFKIIRSNSCQVTSAKCSFLFEAVSSWIYNTWSHLILPVSLNSPQMSTKRYEVNGLMAFRVYQGNFCLNIILNKK